MNRKTKLLVLILSFILSTAPAFAELSFQGKVISAETIVVPAPFGGIVDRVYARAGDPVHIGDSLAAMQTTKVYAQMDGVVSGIFGKEGDNTEGIVTRYGGVMYLEPLNQFIVTATTEKAYNSGAARFIHLGEQVYLSCTKDGSHRGVAVVTKVDDLDENGNTPYRLEVLSGSFYMGETVGVYRRPNYASTSRLGRGTVKQNAALAVTGTGSILKIHVKEGDHVERGELLFETVEGALDGLFAVDSTITSSLDGIIASVDASQGTHVDKNGKIISIYPRDAMQIEMLVSQLDLPDIHEGDPVTIEFEWDVDAKHGKTGKIARISRMGAASKEKESESKTTTTSDSKYSVYVDFEPDDTVSLDMTVIVHMDDMGHGEDDPEELEKIEAEIEAVEEGH